MNSTRRLPRCSLLAATDTCHRLYPKTRAESMARVRVSTLDRVLEAAIATMPSPILLKLDVQDFEDRVLRGGKHVLSRCRAVVLEVCVEPLYESQADFLDLALMLRDSGFRYVGNLDQSYGDDGRVLFFDAIFRV